MMFDSAESGDNAALISFCVYTAIVFLLAWLASRKREGKSFMSEYFLGSRSLGIWAFAFTYAATSASGGSFMGFPAKIYTHGWVMALWIGGYIVAPLVAVGLIAKRLNQVARKSGSITVPEMLRKRLGSPTVGQVATVLLVFFQFFFLLAQFKAGAKIMTTLLGDVGSFNVAKEAIESALQPLPWIGGPEADGAYYLCLLVFAVSVVAYTAWGGFRAVVWTDVMQGVVMLFGVILLLGLALKQVGGLSSATKEVAQMVPPENGVLKMDGNGSVKISQGMWFKEVDGNQTKYFRAKKDATITATNELAVICMPRPTVGETKVIEEQMARQETVLVAFTYEKESEYKYGAGKQGVYVSAPGPSAVEVQGFLPVILAMCFFAFWPFAGSGQPSYMARQMAFRDTPTLRHSIIFVMVYFSLIYFPLIIIFTCSRVLLPGWEIDSDRIMPEIAVLLTSNAGAPWLAGLLLAAPFAAVMSSVDSFLLLFSSTITRDVYQQKNPDATEDKLKKVSYAVTVIVGVMAVIAMLKPPQFLQDLIVFGSGGLAASFLMPVIFMLYWPRLTPTAAVAGMVSGGGTIGLIYLIGYFVKGKFGEIPLLGLHPFIWSVAVSALVIVMVARNSRPPDKALVEKYFGGVGNIERNV